MDGSAHRVWRGDGLERGAGGDVRATLLRDPWFSALPPPLMTGIIERSTRRDYPTGALIYGSGDPPTGQFAVLSGQVRLIANTTQGKLVLYRILQPGSWFGHLAVLDGKPRFQDAVAVGPTTLLHLPMAGFSAIVEAEPRYAMDFTQLVCAHIRLAMEMLAEAMTMPFSGRLAHVVLNTAGDDRDDGSPRVTQDALAAMTGASRQTVNRVLRRWEKEGLVSLRYARVVVHDRPRLEAMARNGELPAV